MSGRWVRRVQTLEDHKCKPPMKSLLGGVSNSKHHPDGSVGDVWECSCGKQYKIKAYSGEYSPTCWVRKWWRYH